MSVDDTCFLMDWHLPSAHQKKQCSQMVLSLHITGMHCTSCANKIEQHLSQTEGVVSCNVQFVTNQARVAYDNCKMTSSDICSCIETLGFRPTVLSVQNADPSGAAPHRNFPKKIPDLAKPLPTYESKHASMMIVDLTIKARSKDLAPVDTQLRHSFLKEISGIYHMETHRFSPSKCLLRLCYNPHMVQVRWIVHQIRKIFPFQNYTITFDDFDLSHHKRQLEIRHLKSMVCFCSLGTAIVLVLVHLPSASFPFKLHVVFALATFIHCVGGAPIHQRAFQNLWTRDISMDCLISFSTNLAYWYSTVALVYHLFLRVKTPPQFCYFFETPCVLITSVLLGHLIKSVVINASLKVKQKLQSSTSSDPHVLLLRDSPSPTLSLFNVDQTSPLLGGTEMELSLDTQKPAPDLANGTVHTLHKALLQPGDTVFLSAGMTLPADGIVMACSNPLYIDVSVLTGESQPLQTQQDDFVIGGSVVTEGHLFVKITEIGSKSYMGMIQAMIDSATSPKSNHRDIADQISQWFGPAICLISFLTFSTWCSLTILTSVVPIGATTLWDQFLFCFQRSIAVIAVACPCAIGLATPTVTALAFKVAADKKVLFLNLAALEQARVTDVIFDKTGTLTKGYLQICKVYLESSHPDIEAFTAETVPETQTARYAMAMSAFLQTHGVLSDHLTSAQLVQLYGVLWMAASAQHSFTHPISRCLRQTYVNLGHFAAREGLSISKVVRPVTTLLHEGEGIQAQLPCVTKEIVCMGNRRLLSRIFGPTSDETENAETDNGMSTLHLVLGKQVVCTFVFSADVIREEALAVLGALRQKSIVPWMCTGDKKSAALHIGLQLGIDPEHIFAELTPVEKTSILTRIRSLRSRCSLLMVGDGVNDAPSLKLADVGISFHCRKPIVMASADVICMHPDLRLILDFLHLSAKATSLIRQNYIWAFGFNAIMIVAATGLFYPRILISPALAGVFMALSSVFVICNSLRIAQSSALSF